MAQDQAPSAPNGETPVSNSNEGSSLPLRRSGRTRKRHSDHSEDADYERGPTVAPGSTDNTRRNPKRRAAPEHFNIPDNLLEASLGPWKENEQAEWASWTELESDPVRFTPTFRPPRRALMTRQAFFTAILGLLGVKGARIEEVLSVDEESLAALPYVTLTGCCPVKPSLLTLPQCSGPWLGVPLRICFRGERRGHRDQSGCVVREPGKHPLLV
jgi:ubiquitin carboxyl-terminal hydrolase L5